MAEHHVGIISHYYPKAHAAVLHLDAGAGLRLGDQVHIVGSNEDFWEEVTSLQMDHQSVDHASHGDQVGLLVEKPVHAGAEVFRLDAIEAHP